MFAVVHDNKTMILVKKVHCLERYLRLKLGSESAWIINTIPLSTEDYESAMELISNNYDNSQRRFENYLQCLTDLNDLTIVFIYMSWKGDSIKKQRDIGRDRFLMRRVPNMKTWGNF